MNDATKNYAKQFNDMADVYIGAQQHIWNDWLDMMQNWTRQSQQLAESSAEAGKQMVESWLEAGSRFGSIEILQPWSGTWQEAMTAWQESVDKLLQMQADAFGSGAELSVEDKKPSSKTKKENGKPAEERAA